MAYPCHRRQIFSVNGLIEMGLDVIQSLLDVLPAGRRGCGTQLFPCSVLPPLDPNQHLGQQGAQADFMSDLFLIEFGNYFGKGVLEGTS